MDKSLTDEVERAERMTQIVKKSSKVVIGIYGWAVVCTGSIRQILVTRQRDTDPDRIA